MDRRSESFGIVLLAVKPGKIYILGDALSRILNDKAVINVIEIPYIEFSEVINGYDDDQFFEPFVQALNGKSPRNITERATIERVIHSSALKISGNFTTKTCVYSEKLCHLSCKLVMLLNSVVISSLQKLYPDKSLFIGYTKRGI